jgi:solute carrier family 25 (mitochondrial iron transporter), member 28/37
VILNLFGVSFAGLAEHVVIFPLDTLKTNIQCEICGSSSPFKTYNCAKRIVRQDGIMRLWRGVGAMFAGCIPGNGNYACLFTFDCIDVAHAAYFSIFEAMKVVLGANGEGHFPVQAAICGALATFSHDMVMVPFDVVKQRMQLGYHNSILDCAGSILRSEGPRALYLSLPTTIAMNIPYGCVMVACNESARKILNPQGGYSLVTSLIAGCVSGAFASLVTTPLDVVKTRLQTQDLKSRSTSNPSSQPKSTIHNTSQRFMVSVTATPDAKPVCNGQFSTNIPTSRKYNSMMQTIRRIGSEEGFAAFWKGSFPRMLVQAPSVAISWTAYEFAKGVIHANKS